eukprot:365999-Chlamydomonas_euryale.AAC.2
MTFNEHESFGADPIVLVGRWEDGRHACLHGLCPYGMHACKSACMQTCTHVHRHPCALPYEPGSGRAAWLTKNCPGVVSLWRAALQQGAGLSLG